VDFSPSSLFKMSSSLEASKSNCADVVVGVVVGVVVVFDVAVAVAVVVCAGGGVAECFLGSLGSLLMEGETGRLFVFVEDAGIDINVNIDNDIATDININIVGAWIIVRSCCCFNLSWNKWVVVVGEVPVTFDL
jgi:hypothetical protein